MTIEGEGAGKGDTYRSVNRNKYNKHFEEIKWPARCKICGVREQDHMIEHMNHDFQSNERSK